MIDDAIRPIPTFYRGHHFRSRLEARWAVFFQTLGLDWEYEPEAFRIGGGHGYLPDFRIKFTWRHVDLNAKKERFHVCEGESCILRGFDPFNDWMYVEVKPTTETDIIHRSWHALKHPSFKKAAALADFGGPWKPVLCLDGPPAIKTYDMMHAHTCESGGGIDVYPVAFIDSSYLNVFPHGDHAAERNVEEIAECVLTRAIHAARSARFGT
jgi:hypothetical protein